MFKKITKRDIRPAVIIFFSVIAITFLLYYLPPIYARNTVILYYFPIAFATFRFGRVEGLAIVFICSMLYFPFILSNSNNPLFVNMRYEITMVFHIFTFISLPFLIDYFAGRLRRERKRYQNLCLKLDKKVEHLLSLSNIQKEISSAFSLSNIQESIMDAVMKVLDVSSCSVWLIDEESSELYCANACGEEKEKIKDVRLKFGEGISGWVAKFGIPQKVDDLSKDIRYKNPLGREQILTSQLSAPLKVRNKIIGVINVFNKKEEEFTEDDLSLLVLFAGHSAISMENAKLYEETRQKLHEISALLEVSKVMILTTDLDDLLNIIMEISMNLLHADSGSLMLTDRDTSYLRIKIIKGAREDFNPEEFTVSIGEGIAGQVASDGNPQIVHKGDPLLSGKKVIYKDEVCSTVSVPLKIQDMITGVLNLNSTKDYFRFSTRDVDILSAFASQSSLAIEKSRLYDELIETNLRTMQSLAHAIDARDSYTAGHSQQTTGYVIKIARKVKLSEYDVKLLEYASLLHDIGKIGISDEILKKPSQLSGDEFEYIKKHVKIGANIIQPVEFLRRVVPFIYYHHERYDGTGYPDGLKGEEIPIGARILTVVDSYGAMTSDRPYRKALSEEEAVAELIKWSGSQFDPEVISAFLEIVEEEKNTR